MPLRISGSCSTSPVWKATPRWSRIATARLEKPHCGKSGVPFMNRTMSLFFTTSSMRSRTSVMSLPLLGDAGGQLERVELGAHAPAQGLVDALMLAHERLAAKALRDHPRFIMVAVAGE